MSGWAETPELVQLVLKGTVVLGAGLVAARLLARSSAAVRHAALVATMAAAALLPFLAGALPDWSVPVLDRAVDPAPPAMSVSVVEGVSPGEAEPRAPAGVVPDVSTTPRAEPSAVARAAGSAVAEADRPVAPAAGRIGPRRHGGPAMPRSPTAPGESGVPVRALLAVWAGGALLFAARWAIDLARVAALSRDAVRDPGGPQSVRAARIAAALGIRRRVAVRFSDRMRVPVTWGVARPVLLLPLEACEWGAARSRVVLLHELAHVRRNDWLSWAVVEGARAMWWFHPLAWICRSRARIELERACDDVVLASGAGSVDYASTLVDVARDARGGVPAPSAAIPMARASTLRDRVETILGPAARRVRLGRRAAAVVVAAAAAVVVPLAAVHLWGDTTEARERARMIADLGSAEAGVRAAAAWELGARAVGEAVDPLVARLEDPDPAVRGVAARALGKIGDPRAVEPLLGALADPDTHVRELAILGLQEIDDSRRVDAIAGALGDPEMGVRSVAVSALSQIGGSRALQALVTAARTDPDPHTRGMAMAGIAKNGGRDAVPALIGLLDHADPRVRDEAALALGRLGDGRAVSALVARIGREPDDDVRERAVDALGPFVDDPRAVEGLLLATGDAAWRVRASAVGILADRDDPRVVPALLEALRDPVHQVRLTAAWALDTREEAGS